METSEQQSGSVGVAKTKTAKPVYRKIWFWLVVLVVLYALAGFLLLPWWLERMLPQQLEQRMGWQAQIEDIRTNPFRLSVDARALTADDPSGEKVLGFDRLYVNVGFLRLFTGVIELQSIELEEPFIRVDLLEDYSVNFARDWQQANRDQPADDSTDDSSSPPSLYFEALTVSGGELLFRDFSQSEAATFSIEPLDLRLNDLATWQREDDQSSYYLQAALGDQTIEWEGELSINPVYSRGNLRIADLDHATVRHFIKPYVPYDLRGGNATLSTDYELRSSDQLFLTTSAGVLELENLELSPDAEREEAALTTGRMAVDEIRFGLSRRTAEVGVVTVEALDLAVERDAAGDIDWLLPWQSGDQDTDDASDPDSDAGGQPFQWSVAGVEISDSRIRWRDQQPEVPVEVEAGDLSLTLGRLSEELEEPVDYRLQASLTEEGSLGLQGQVTPRPFTLEAGVNGSTIDLAVFGPYIRQLANLEVRSGRLTLDGNLDLDGQQDPLTGTFNGTGELTALDVTLPGSDEPLIDWQTLRLEPVAYNVHPARLEIGTVTLSEPSINVVRENDGLHNLERIIRASDDNDDSGASEASSDGDNNAEPDFIFRIEQFLLENGEVSYTDRALEPAFTTTVESLKGTVSGIANVTPQQGKVSVSGLVNGSSELNLEGSLGTLGTDDVSQLTLAMKGASLPRLSPYFGRYLGYGVDSGKLDVDMNYEITGSRIDASNLIVMDRLELGQQVTSEEAVNVPVRLGLALLRDSEGIIEINLPISGDLDDPDFSVGKVVMRAFVNVLSKAASSPFSVLGSVAELAGLSGEQLSEIRFLAGKVELAEGERDKLDALAGALRERPALLLNIRGSVAPEADGLALLRQRLTEQRGGSLSDDEWAQAREAYLAGDRSLPPEALGNLASSRGTWLRQQLLEDYGVDSGQLFLRDPERDAKADDQGLVAVRFALDAR
ncbi:MAG: DUF748 domain-containing protein [Pseudomonadota bacterium]